MQKISFTKKYAGHQEDFIERCLWFPVGQIDVILVLESY